MPSITYWNRLEPSPRANDFTGPLAARVHDGLWFITRQWQLGEFHGEDAGSAAWIEVDTTSVRMAAWLTSQNVQIVDAGVPLEKAVGETLPLDLATAVDLGETFEAMLNDPTLVAPFRAAYPIAPASPADEASGDAELLRFRSVMAGRALDGAALFYAASASLPLLPPQPAINSLPKRLAASSALQSYVAIVRELFGGPPGTPSPAWNAPHFAYEFDVSVGGLGGYSVRPGNDGEATWEAFSGSDLQTAVPTLERPEQTKISCLPASVRFRGMPSNRWWDFDNAMLDAGAIDFERRDTAKLLLSDLLILHGDEWFIAPIDQKVGTVMRLDVVLVRDVFGVLTLIPPAAAPNWTMFAIDGPVPAQGSLFPPTATAAVQYGAPIEETRFIRDEMMNMAWAIEETTIGPLGQPLRGYDVAARHTPDPPDPTITTLPRYLLRPPAPPYWVPYLPAAGADGVMFERATPAKTPPRISEEELRRSGIRVERVVARSRGFCGDTYLWLACRKNVAPAETTSASPFDVLVKE